MPKFFRFTLHLSGFLILVVLLNGCKSSNTTRSIPEESGPNAQQNRTSQLVANGALRVEETPSPIYRAAKSKIWDLLHTRLEISFDWENQYVNGIAQLELTPYFYSQENLILDAKGFDILKITKLTREGQMDLVYEYDGDQVNIALDREYVKGEKVQIRIEYIAKPNERGEGGSEAISSDKGLYFINPDNSQPNKPQQIWTQGETESNSVWFPTIDSPNEKCTQEMFITVKDKLKTLSNGTLVYSRKNEDGTRTDYWKMDKPHAPYLFMMAIGEFSVVREEESKVPIDYWVEPEFEEYADDIFGNTPEMMAFFSELFDYPYPWEKYSQVVVRDYVSGAMENTTASVFMEDLQVTDRELLDEHWDHIIAHELMHQWFGDLVTCESWSNLPLNEGFANYSEYLWNEYKYGIDEADYNGWVELQNYLSEAESKQVPLIRYYYEDKEDMFDSHSYAKAGRVLHMLRKYVGDEAFFMALNHYLKANAYQSVEIDDLRLSFEEVTGEDLNWFFDQWFLLSGHPIINVSHLYEQDSLHIYIGQFQDTTLAPVFKLPLYLDVFSADEIDRYALMIEEVAEQYSFYYPDQPDLVLFDSEQQLVGEVNHPKSAEELHYQFLNGENFLTRFFALFEIQESLNDSLKRSIVKAALRDPSWRIRSEAVDLCDENRMLDDPKVISILEELSRDEKSLVRASALAALTQSSPGDYKDLIKSSLQDSSYSVAGVALSALLTFEESPDVAMINDFAESNNINVLIPVADYYLAQRDFEKYDWFAEKISNLKGQSLYFFLQYFNQYLVIALEEQRRSSVQSLEQLALQHHLFYVRLAAFQGLIFLLELEGVEEIISRVKSKEKDSRLTDYYSQY